VRYRHPGFLLGGLLGSLLGCNSLPFAPPITLTGKWRGYDPKEPFGGVTIGLTLTQQGTAVTGAGALCFYMVGSCGNISVAGTYVPPRVMLSLVYEGLGDGSYRGTAEDPTIEGSLSGLFADSSYVFNPQ